MANEFIIKNGFVSKGDSIVEGGLTATTISANTIYVSGSSLSRPYKVYTALIKQSGATAPEPTILENTIGNIVWSYLSAGRYHGTLTGAFPLNKTFYSTNGTFSDDGGASPYKSYLFRNNDDIVELTTTTSDGTFSDNLIFGENRLSIEVRVYN